MPKFDSRCLSLVFAALLQQTFIFCWFILSLCLGPNSTTLWYFNYDYFNVNDIDSKMSSPGDNNHLENCQMKFNNTVFALEGVLFINYIY